MRRFSLILSLLCWVVLAATGRGESFKLTTGQEITGELLLTSANEAGIQIKIAEGNYERVPWSNFAQEDLRKFAQNPKLQPLVEPWVDITPEEKIKKTEVKITPPPRLERAAPQSLFGAMFSSSVGLFLVLVLYGANIYAGYEVAIFRAQPQMLVAGLSAIPLLGFAAPIAFLAMPTRLKPTEEAPGTVVEPMAEPAAAAAPAASGADPLNPMQAEGVQHPAGLKLAHEEKPAGPKLPETVVYKRGEFTFNRRFFETKFPNFFGVVRREGDKDMLFIVKSSRGEYTAQRISRIAANDFHLLVHRGHATEEVMVPFIEIQEVRVQHKDAK